MNDFELQPVIPGEIPEWEQAHRLVFPFLQPVSGSSAFVPALTSDDILAGMVTAHIKMCIALYYRGSVIPLTDRLIREWSVSIAIVRLAMEENINTFMNMIRSEQHEKDGIVYYTINNQLPFFDSMLPVFKPFQKTMLEKLGTPCYFAVPERRTAVLFGNEYISSYQDTLRDDIILTHDCSSRALSTELIEVSPDGIIPVMDY